MSQTPRKVLLIDPLIPGGAAHSTTWAPLGLAYLAATLRQAGHEVVIQNRLMRQVRGRLSLDQIDRMTADLLRTERPGLIGISGTTFSYADIHAVAALARKECPEALVVLGGPHATAAPADTLQLIPAADCVIIGEGESLIVDLVAEKAPADLSGAVWRDGEGAIRHNPWQPPDWTLDSLPHPARDLMDMGWYVTHSRRGVRAAPLPSTTQLTSRGCPFRCAFCSEAAYTVRGVRVHSPEYVVAEAEEILARYPCRLLVFLDEMFTTDRARVMALMDLWQTRGLHQRVQFSAQARADSIDAELLAALKRAGCLQLELGVESGSEAMLQRMRKGVTAEQNRRAVRVVQEAGIRVQVNVILGCPDETEAEALETVRFLDEARPDVVALLRFVPLPNTEFTRQLIEQGRLDARFWAIEDRQQSFPVTNFTAMAPARSDEIYNTARKLVDEINDASWRQVAPIWMRARRQLGNVLRKAGLLRRRH